MFDIGWSEMMVVGAVALVVIGPKDLPGALRQAGKWLGTVRRMASDFQGQVNEAMKEAELDELRNEVANLKSGLNAVTDPVRTAGNQMKAIVEQPANEIRAAETEAKAIVEKPAALPPPKAEPAAAKPAASKPAAATPKPKARAAPRKKPASAKSETKA